MKGQNDKAYSNYKKGIRGVVAKTAEKAKEVRSFLFLGLRNFPRFIKLLRELYRSDKTPDKMKLVLASVILLAAAVLGIKVVIGFKSIVIIVLTVFLPALIPLGGEPHSRGPDCAGDRLFRCRTGVPASRSADMLRRAVHRLSRAGFTLRRRANGVTVHG